jgi:hypothetical protein
MGADGALSTLPFGQNIMKKQDVIGILGCSVAHLAQLIDPLHVAILH